MGRGQARVGPNPSRAPALAPAHALRSLHIPPAAEAEGPADMRGDGDEGHLQVLEAMLVTLVLLGAAYAVITLKVPSTESDRTRDRLDKLATDALLILAGLNETRGTVLDLGITESLHCLADGAAPGASCLGNKSANLSFRIDSYLPEGAGYALSLHNGAASRDLFRNSMPTGEAVSSSHTYVPDWNMTFLTTELSCYESGMSVNATLAGLRHGAVASLSYGNVTNSTGAEVSGEKAAAAGWWNLTIPAAGRPPADVLYANATGKRGTYPGTTVYGACSLGGLGPAIRAAAATSTVQVLADNATVPLGRSVDVRVDLSPLATVAGATLSSMNLTIYEPITPRNWTDGYAVAAVLPIPSPTGTVTWTVPDHALYGAHPALVRVLLLVGVVPVEARIPTIVVVGLPSGAQPIEPAYTATIQAWFPDWR